MNKNHAALLGLSLFLLSACSPSTVIVADVGQIGAGATVTRDGDVGALHIPPSANWPKGWNALLTVSEAGGILPDVQQILTFRTANNLELSFITIGDKYVCQTCRSLNLPVEWHRAKK
jgi:hypothetical protein